MEHVKWIDIEIEEKIMADLNEFQSKIGYTFKTDICLSRR